MAKPFEKLRAEMSPASTERAEKLSCDLRNELRMTQLRNALKISQDELGELLSNRQAAIALLERDPDISVSTLREFIRALGGKLEIIASFPDASYHIKQFELSDGESEDDLIEA